MLLFIALTVPYCSAYYAPLFSVHATATCAIFYVNLETNATFFRAIALSPLRYWYLISSSLKPHFRREKKICAIEKFNNWAVFKKPNFLTTVNHICTCLMFTVSLIMSLVQYYTSPILLLRSHVSCLTSHIRYTV